MQRQGFSLTQQQQFAAIAELNELLSRHRIAYWLFGGWAVDFHLGRITRSHADIDMAVWSIERAHVAELLLDNEWMHRPDPDEDGYTCYERAGVRLEIAFLARDERGHIYTPLRNGRGEWPAGSFDDAIAALNGVRARVVGLDALIADKSVARSDPDTAAKDRADIARLVYRAKRAGIRWPW